MRTEKYCVIFDKNPALSAALQQHAFSLGYKWAIGGTTVAHTEMNALYLWQDMTICYSRYGKPEPSGKLLTIEQWFALGTKPERKFKVESRTEEFVLSADTLTIGCHTITKADALIIASEIIEYYK